jgi:hypothetical protein
MQHTIKTCTRAAGLVCLAFSLTFTGCNVTNKPGSADSLAKKDTTVKDSSKIVKAAVDSTSLKKAPVDSSGNPPAHVPKVDTTVKPRPLGRKT